MIGKTSSSLRGQPQELVRFEWVSDLPVHTGLLLDVSGSMEASLETVADTARRFVEQTIRPDDRLALVTFHDRPRVIERFTNDVAAVHRSLAALRSEGGTALYDSPAKAGRGPAGYPYFD